MTYLFCMNRMLILLCFFFFQAEDGIRDFHVTGVQTCALPIYASRVMVRVASDEMMGAWAVFRAGPSSTPRKPSPLAIRSRKIGRASCREKCRSRWSPDH